MEDKAQNLKEIKSITYEIDDYDKINRIKELIKETFNDEVVYILNDYYAKQKVAGFTDVYSDDLKNDCPVAIRGHQFRIKDGLITCISGVWGNDDPSELTEMRWVVDIDLRNINAIKRIVDAYEDGQHVPYDDVDSLNIINECDAEEEEEEEE